MARTLSVPPLGVGFGHLDTALRIPRPVRLLYHYTSQEGLLGIVKSRLLWASSIFHLNDSLEFLYTVNLAEETLRSVIAGQPRRTFYKRLLGHSERALAFVEKDIFAVSFSEVPDLLSQWRAYTGGGAGFSIGSETKKLLDRAKEQGFQLVKCIYDPLVQKRILRKVIHKARELHLAYNFAGGALQYMSRVAALASLFKHPSFAEEKEWRIVSDFLRSYPSKWRAGKSMIIPYADFRLASANNPLSISRVYVGPTPDLGLSSRSVRALLSGPRMSGTRSVYISGVPYRSW